MATRGIGLLVGLLASALALAQGRALLPGQVLWQPAAAKAADGAATEALAQAVWQRLEAGDGPGAVDLVAAAAAAPLRQHGALQAVLTRLEAGAPLPAAGPLLDYAAAQPVRVLRQHEETAAAFYLPVFDPAAAAADVRSAWAIARRRDALLAELAVASVLPEPGKDAIEEAALQAAIDALPVAAAQRLAGAAAKRLPSPPLALALARRSGDPVLASALLEHPDPAVRLAAFSELLPRLDAASQRNWLLRLEGDTALASAATLALVPELAAADALPALLARLADPARGDSTAAALAALPDALHWIDRLWTASADAHARRMLLLALSLHDSEAARARRQALLAQQEGQP